LELRVRFGSSSRGQPAAACGVRPPTTSPKELEHQLFGALRVVDEGPVPAAVQDLDAGAGEGLALPLGQGDRQVGVVAAPDDQGRAVQRPQRRPEPDAGAGRVVGGPVQGQDGPLGATVQVGVQAVDERLGEPAGVAVAQQQPEPGPGGGGVDQLAE
jgi:hypothetical protein